MILLTVLSRIGQMDGPHKIIVVEDEPGIADTIEYALTSEGFAVSRATTGKEALLQIRGGAALALIDVGLPDMNGFDLCREIRSFSKMPVIFLTARAEAIDRIIGLEIGADDYLAKPFHPRELVARVRAILRRTPAGADVQPAEAPPAGLPFRVDPQRRQICYFGSPLILSRYEYSLLELLISRPGWVFTRDKLMQMVWDEPDSSLERTVDTHIKTIRSRLREIRPEIEAIVTHRGVGYSMREDW